MSRRNLFTGRSGQLALMAEFLIRELNVAIPEVDVGDDIVVVRDDDDIITRVQVKTANANRSRNGHFSAQFNVPLRQLELGPRGLVYAFVVRHRQRWEEFVILRRSILYELKTRYGLGSEDGKGSLVLALSFSPRDILSKGLSLQAFRSRFEPWPPPAEIPDGVTPDFPS